MGCSFAEMLFFFSLCGLRAQEWDALMFDAAEAVTSIASSATTPQRESLANFISKITATATAKDAVQYKG